MALKDHKLGGAAACPWCHEEMTGATDVTPGKDGSPEGAFAICGECAEVSIITGGRQLRKPTPEEQADADSDDRLQGFRVLVKSRFRRPRG